MKLNNRGWGLQAMMVFVLILMICLVIVAALIDKNFNGLVKENNSFDYGKLENELVDAAKKYVSNKNINLEYGESHTVSLEKLQSEKLIGDIRDDYSKCKGYVTLSNHGSLSYKSYIKCGSNYKTKGYSEI